MKHKKLTYRQKFKEYHQEDMWERFLTWLEKLNHKRSKKNDT
ncbi:hypothetical protein LCGC14_1139200 [marine sediment metagenome]|uniref:Uncharacterized protein n=1 Tax=marine sediment metagenome TaxID=412755 RepID=A0A0F9MLS0_9ZZZZ